MRTITLLLLIAILTYTTTHAQSVNIPDTNFEQALIDLGYDTVLDNSVLEANINAVTSLNIQNQNISDLTGIEAFGALQLLYVDNNNLTSLNVTQNTALTLLSCSGNSITSLDVRQNTALDYLDARFNLLTEINLSQNTVLQTLSLNDNQLTLLNLNQNALLSVVSCTDNNLGGISILNGNNTGLISFNATNNPGLTCIQVDDVAYANANWTNIDPQTGFNTSCLSEINTYVPDDNFEQALIDLGYDSGPLDDYVLRTNINTVTILNVDNKNIDDLTGIKDFVALEELSCAINNLSNLNISNNTQLQLLNCAINNLTALNVSQNTQLQNLWCSGNQIVNLDVSENALLDNLQCQTNQLTSLDLSQNTLLTYLNVSNNQLISLDLSNNTLLSLIYCTDNQLFNLELSQNTTLITSLDCRANQITDINVSTSPDLTYLNVTSNQLPSLDVTNNTALTDLLCDLNALSTLDLSQNTSLEILDCSANQLASLDIKSGNNTTITFFNASLNPSLTCIEVDDAAYSTTNWTLIDAQTSFNEDCHYNETFVPDDNFEQALIDLGYDSGPLDDYVPTANIDTITTLDISSKGIADLTGIEDFTLLEELNVNTNNLTNLDVSQNTNLIVLECANNELTDLNVSQNSNLTELQCSLNNITILDLSLNTALISLSAIGNGLSSLNVNSNTALEILNCGGNDLTSLDVSQNSVLTTLDVVSNDITTLDLSQNTALQSLNCPSNQLTSLNLKNGNNTAITSFQAVFNPNLTCIEVDDAAYSTANWTLIDAQTSFSEDCSDTNCNNAQPITVSSTINTVNFNLIDEPINNEEGCSGTVADYADTWFEFILESDGAVGINGSVNVNRFALYDACEGTEIACFNNFGIIENLTNGTTYKLRVFRTAATASNSNFTSFDIIFDDTLNTEDFTSSKVSVALYPNPSSDIVTITSNVTEKIGTISIIDVSGKKLLSQNQSNIINVKHLANGMYFVTIEVGQQIITKKLLIKK
jgi:Leucine-rich repeat (LRR) protein